MKFTIIKFLIYSIISAHLYGANFPAQLEGLSHFRTNEQPGNSPTVIVVDTDFYGLDINQVKMNPPKDITYAVSNFLESESYLSEDADRMLRQFIKQIKDTVDLFAKNGVKIDIDWDNGIISNYDADEKYNGFKDDKNLDDKHYITLLGLDLKNYREYRDLVVASGHGLQVSRIVAGANGIIPSAKIIPISTNSTVVKNLEVFADDGNGASSVNKALFVATYLAENMSNIEAINLSISLNCDQSTPSCISQFRLWASLLEKAAENSIIFYPLENENSSFFGSLPGEKLIVQAAKNIAERHGHPKLIFIINLEEKSGELLSGKAFGTADFTLANIGTYKLPRATNEQEITEVNGTSFASPASMAQFLLLKGYLATRVKNLTDKMVINLMFEQADRFYKGKNLSMGFYGRGFMNMNKYADYIKNNLENITE